MEPKMEQPKQYIAEGTPNVMKGPEERSIFKKLLPVVLMLGANPLSFFVYWIFSSETFRYDFLKCGWSQEWWCLSYVWEIVGVILGSLVLLVFLIVIVVYKIKFLKEKDVVMLWRHEVLEVIKDFFSVLYIEGAIVIWLGMYALITGEPITGELGTLQINLLLLIASISPILIYKNNIKSKVLRSMLATIVTIGFLAGVTMGIFFWELFRGGSIVPGAF